MNPVLEKAQAHRTEAGDHSLHKIDVDEWGSSIWFKAVSSMDGNQYQQYFQTAQRQDYEGLVDLLLLRARKEDGLKMFGLADKAEMMATAMPSVVTTIVRQMSAVDNARAESEKKA